MNTSNDKQIETLTEIHSYSDYFIGLMKNCAESITNNKVNRSKRLVITDDNISDEFVICIKDSKNILTGLIVIFEGFYNLSVNDTLRSRIYFNEDFKKNFKIILFHANLFEQKLCLRVLSQLTFNEIIADEVKCDPELTSYINKNLDQTTDENIKKYCNQINWNIYKEEQQEIVLQQIETQADEKSEKHIMISYNSTTRELCLKIKDKLEHNGYKVWIDVTDIHGSSLDSMAKAVEGSSCVLICVNEKYRLSIYCQAEAQYAFRLNKPLIPLIMQKDYEKITGWLGIILGDKIFVNFTKYSFDDCISRLLKELKPYSTIHESILSLKDVKLTNHSGHDIAPTEKRVSEAEKMTSDEVAKWFVDQNISKVIVDNLSNSDGITLKQLNDIRIRDPEFYNQSLRSFQGLNIFDIAKFSSALEHLFK